MPEYLNIKDNNINIIYFIYYKNLLLSHALELSISNINQIFNTFVLKIYSFLIYTKFKLTNFIL